MTPGRRRDRAVYTRSHPALFALLTLTRRAATVRIGRTVLVHGTDPYRDALTRLPLDRAAAGTTGGIARDVSGGEGVLFDQAGADHRGARRALADALSAPGVERLRRLGREVLERRAAALATGGRVDVVDVAVELSGTVAAELLGLDLPPRRLAGAARAAAAAAARAHLPGPLASRNRHRARAAAGELLALIGDERAAMLAVAAVNTTVAALPRAVAWCADDGLWPQAADPATAAALAGELLRVLAPSPLLPRVAAADGTLAGRPVRAGDRLILVTRHAARAHDRDPDAVAAVPAATAQLVFGAGPHACPGARLARAQLVDALAAFAPYRPVVSRARVDRRSALPGWGFLEVSACG
ncbi:cytochrome P450 [Planosporangium thailandense]|uniref:Cytochrome P450 n=1 Tax=Planosporangium thailandense TaxID=765197 RepID=A0ABX0XZX7_9ACTN|nr:cytochrome P450 [Planosporangium thailandense]NJC71452.1 cytochrome P450 [Planosporangium thailandense]